MLNKKLQQAQDQNQKDIETRIQVIMFIIMSIINYNYVDFVKSSYLVKLLVFSLSHAFKISFLLSIH